MTLNLSPRRAAMVSGSVAFCSCNNASRSAKVSLRIPFARTGGEADGLKIKGKIKGVRLLCSRGKSKGSDPFDSCPFDPAVNLRMQLCIALGPARVAGRALSGESRHAVAHQQET